ADETEMHLEHAFGGAEVRFLGAAESGHRAREQRAHAAVRNDRRLFGEPLEEAAHASSWMVRPSIPPATVTSSPVTWPESSSEARTTTARATSSACGKEGQPEVRAQRRLPTLERQLPDGAILARPRTRDRRADVDTAELPLRRLEQRVDLGLHGQVGPERDAAGLARELGGAVAAR